MSGKNQLKPLGLLLSDEQLLMTVGCVQWALRAVKRKAKWRTLQQNMADSPSYVKLLELEAILRAHLVVRELTSRPLGVPPRGARGLGDSPEHA